MRSSPPSIDSLHTQACARGQESYIDPSTGYQVFTAISLGYRRNCCGCGCRHCPFGHELVPLSKRRRLRQDPWLEGPSGRQPCDLLSWSGGKDSFLALQALAREGAREVMLLTTFDGRSEQVAHQEVQLDDIRVQAETLGLGLLLIPLYPESDYRERLTLGILRARQLRPVRRLVFGDLHLEHVRGWRESELGPSLRALGIELHFPLWKRPYTQLEADFFSSGASATLSALPHAGCAQRFQIGQPFSPELLSQLPEGVDRFGENGEFHTLVEPPEGGWRALTSG